MSNVIKQVVAGVAPYATDVDQFRQILSGTADPGTMVISGPTTAPAAPSVSAGSTGALTGAYKYKLVAATGWKENNGTMWVNGFSVGAEASITLSGTVCTVPIPALVSPVIAYLVYRTVASGATNTEHYCGYTMGPTTFTDNVADGSLGTGMPSWSGTSVPAAVPTTNTTGSPLTINSSLTVPGTATIGTLTAANFPKVSVNSVVNTASPLTVVTYSPVVTGNFEAKVYLSVSALTTFSILVVWTDLIGQQANYLTNLEPMNPGAYNLPSLFFTAVAGSTISIVATSTVTFTTFINAAIVGV